MTTTASMQSTSPNGRGAPGDATHRDLERAGLEVNGLTRRFGDRVVVDGLSLSIDSAMVYVLVGPNGAGKTTALSMICGLLRPHRGEVIIAGRRLFDCPVQVRACIGVVPQDLAIFRDLSAEENLRFFGSLYGLRGKRLRAQVSWALEFVGLSDHADELAGRFSGGMQRRLNVAAALVHEPQLLLLDEPTVGVDPQSRSLLIENVGRLRDAGTAILYTTHYMEEAERLADRIGVLDRGRLIAEGTQRELQDRVGGLDRIIARFADVDVDTLAICREGPGVVEASASERVVTLLVNDARRVLARLVNALNGRELLSVEVTEPNLEHVFLTLTGRSLRD